LATGHPAGFAKNHKYSLFFESRILFGKVTPFLVAKKQGKKQAAWYSFEDLTPILGGTF